MLSTTQNCLVFFFPQSIPLKDSLIVCYFISVHMQYWSTVLDNIVKRNEITKQGEDRMKPKDCHAPRLPKIHKGGIPMTGVVSTLESPIEKLSRYLIPILRMIQWGNGLYVKNSR